MLGSLSKLELDRDIEMRSPPVTDMKFQSSLSPSSNIESDIVMTSPQDISSGTSNDLNLDQLINENIPIETETEHVENKENISCVHKNNTCDRFDIGNFLNSANKLTDFEKYELLEKVWKPEKSFLFPVNDKKRKFNQTWLDSFPWLVYSELLDGAFCIHCFLFSKNAMKIGKMSNLCSKPFTDWRNALKMFKQHNDNSPFHKQCHLDSENFKARFSKGSSISSQLNTIQVNIVKKNRLILESIAKILLMMARQNIAFRGRDETDPTAKFQGRDVEYTGNSGNFLEIIKLAVDLGCPVLTEHVETCKRNATYLSKTIQDALIFLMEKKTFVINL